MTALTGGAFFVLTVPASLAHLSTSMQTRFGRWLVPTVLLVGAALRLRQYGAAGALWLDELALARNVIDRSLGPLVAHPLAYGQVAPRGFLLLEKLSVLAFGVGEWQLRLVPLASSLVALALLPVVAARLLGGAASLVAVTLFALNAPQVRYAAEVKPYSTDVAVALGLTLLALEWRRRRGVREAVALALGGIAGAWLSLPALLVLAGLAIVLGWTEWAERSSRGAGGVGPWALGPVALVWLIAAAGSLVVAKHGMSDETVAALQDFWGAGFPPAGGGPGATVVWLARSWRDAFQLTLGYPVGGVYAALAIVGAVFLLRRRRDALMLLLPIAVALAAALARQYPFHSRLLLFLAPALVCLVASAVELASAPLSRIPALAAGVAIVVCAPALGSLRALRGLTHGEEIRPVLAATRNAWRAGDLLYVYSSAWQAMEFYGPRYGFTRDEVRLGGCHRGDPAAVAREVERLEAARRVWILFSHVTPAEQKEVLVSVDRIATREDSVVGPGASPRSQPPSAYLYQLSAGGRITASSGDSGAVVTERCGTGPSSPQPLPGVHPYW